MNEHELFEASEVYRQWGISGMPADKQRLAFAVWQAAKSQPDGLANEPVEPTSAGH